MTLRPRPLTAAAAIALLVVLAASAAFLFAPSGSGAAADPTPTSGLVADGSWFPSPSAAPSAAPSGAPTEPPTPTPIPTPTAFNGPGFQAVNVFATPSPPPRSSQPGDPSFLHDSRRPLPVQSDAWLTLKSSGRVAIVNGKIGLIPAEANPMLSLSTGKTLPAARRLSVSWTRWVVEPYAYGRDERGNTYSDKTFWNLCGPGATTAALYYWQQILGYPNVTGMAGYFLDPYAAEGVSWPIPGPRVAVSGKKRLGTYWSGSDRLNGFLANGRGYLMYLAMAAQPATWQSPGMAVFASGGKPLYPTRGSSRSNIQTVMNWEISGHNADSWTETWYASVQKVDPTIAQDLRTAVMLDIGRDGVPVVGAVDTFNLPNWQAGSATPHTRHAIAIVGYDNTANPPTYSYIDSCGHSCNSRAGNAAGQVHVISQANMVKALSNTAGSGFVW